jgi:hypothetical protein
MLIAAPCARRRPFATLATLGLTALIIAGCSSSSPPPDLQPLQGAGPASTTTTDAAEPIASEPSVDHAQAYVVMVAEANCTGRHLDSILDATFGTGPRALVSDDEWSHIQATLLPAYRAWAEALQRLRAALLSHPWPADVQPHAEERAAENDMAIEWAMHNANAPSLEAYVTQGYVLPSGTNAAAMRTALGLPIGEADETDYCFLAGMPNP